MSILFWLPDNCQIILINSKNKKKDAHVDIWRISSGCKPHKVCGIAYITKKKCIQNRIIMHVQQFYRATDPIQCVTIPISRARNVTYLCEHYASSLGAWLLQIERSISPSVDVPTIGGVALPKFSMSSYQMALIGSFLLKYILSNMIGHDIPRMLLDEIDGENLKPFHHFKIHVFPCCIRSRRSHTFFSQVKSLICYGHSFYTLLIKRPFWLKANSSQCSYLKDFPLPIKRINLS